MILKDFRTLASACLLIFILSSCSPIDGNSLLTDQRSDPSQHIVNKDPAPNELYLRFDQMNNVAVGKDMIELSGDCYASTYNTHKIEFLRRSDNKLLLVRDFNGNVGAYSNYAVCKEGRFHISLERSGDLPVGATNCFARIIADGGTTNMQQGQAFFTVQF